MSQQPVAEAIAILEQAMRNEVQGRRFYLRVAERVRDRRGQELFRAIADDEADHLRLLQTQRDAIATGRPWISIEAAKTLPRYDLTIFPEADAIALSEAATDTDALRLAMDYERQGYELYDRAAAATGDATAKAVFRFLAGEENRHFTLFQDNLNYLNSSASWQFDDWEKQIFEG